MLIWILSKFLGGKIVWLISYTGNIYKTIACRQRNGQMCARVYPVPGVGHVRLHPHGTVTGESFYITGWARKCPAGAVAAKKQTRCSHGVLIQFDEKREASWKRSS